MHNHHYPLSLTLFLGTSLAVLTGLVNASPGRAAPATPHVAVFAQPGFPYYMVSTGVSPASIARGLEKAGVRADLLDVGALSDPAVLNVRDYTALVMPYGNTFPQQALANLQAFHHAGGCLVLSGVPFTHPCVCMSAAGWTSNRGWGENARTSTQAHTGRLSLELKGRAGDWEGVASARRPVKPGQGVELSSWVQEARGSDKGDDWVFARFFNRAGDFVAQSGAKITPGSGWHFVTAKFVVPAGADTLDVSAQIRSAGRTVRIDDIALSVDEKDVPLPNPGFETPGRDWSDMGHHGEAALFGPDGMGVGGFAPGGTAPVKIAAGDPLALASLGRDWSKGGSPQVIDTQSLPAGDTVIPALVEGDRPVAALIVHNDAAFRGAVDGWTKHPDTGDSDAYDTEQILERTAVAILVKKGLVTPEQQHNDLAVLDGLPKPVILSNLKLPDMPRPYLTFQPTMPAPARHLYVADVSSLTRDEKVLLISLQGIVNRAQPRIYLEFDADDRFWFEQMQKQGQTDDPIPVVDADSLLGTFRKDIKGAVVADPNIYLSPCVAVDLAGIDDLVISTPELAKKFNLPIRQDLRGRFTDDADALRYARTELWPRLNPYLSICLDPPLLDSGAIDQIIAARGSCFWVTGPKAQDKPGANTAAEKAELEATLAQMPLNAVVRGFWWHGDGQGLDEGPGVSLGSRFGKVTVVSDYVSNFSVLGGVQIPSLKQKLQPAAPKLDRSKVYVAITMSDGDNLCTWRGFFRQYFTDPDHGKFPVGWGMGPTLIDCAPTIAKWYYDHAAPTDEFLCDVSGIGYIYPPDWATALKDRDGAFKSFYDWTQQYMKRMDMHTLRLMNVRTEDIPHVGSLLPAVQFLMPDYGFAGERTYSQFTYSLPTGQAVFRAMMSDRGPQRLADQIRTRVGATRPAFANAFVWNWGSKLSDLKKMLEILGPDYVAVTPSQLYALYQEATGKGAAPGG